MSSDHDQKRNSRDTLHSRRSAGRPPIEWPGRTEAPKPSDSDRAAELARKHVERTYLRDGEPNTPPKQKRATIEPISTAATESKAAEQPPEELQHTMRDEPYDWTQYHSAWQQYYQQYFYKYYANWWQQQRQQQAQAPQQRTDATQVFATAPLEKEVSDADLTKTIRGKFRSTVKHNAEKLQKSSHFKPLIWSLSVAGAFLLLNYNQVIVGAVKQYIAPGNVVTTPVIVEPNVADSVGPEPKIIIPKIGVEAPVVYDEPNVDEASYQKALERGVVRLGTTADPGTIGNVVIGGHSSNNVFNPGKYKYVFVNLKQLTVNDIFYLNYNGTRYTYKVTVANKIIKPNETSDLNQTAVPTVTLFTCDPPGTNVNRLIVQGVQIDPDPNQAKASSSTKTELNQANPLPSVAPSLWDRITGLLGN